MDNLKCLIKSFFFVSLLELLPGNCSYGQCCDAFITFGDKAATFYPFSQSVDNTFHPVTNIGLEYFYRKKNKTAIFQTGELNLYYHSILGYGMGLRTQTGYRYSFPFRIKGEVLIGAGYIGTIPSEPQYKFSSGKYSRERPFFSRFEALVSLGAGYVFSKGPTVFIRYQYSVMTPYNRSIPAIPTDNLMIGFRTALFRKEKK